jgi:hypothetical protein
VKAFGFHYSAPTIKIAGNYVKPSIESTPSPTASAKPAIIKKTTITCKKGKTSKKVTAVTPKCPSGYKKK